MSLLKHDNAIALKALGIISHGLEITSSTSDKSTVLFNVVYIDENIHQNDQGTTLPNVTWRSLEDLVVAMESDPRTQLVDENSQSTVSEIIHRLADLLPYSGVPLHLLWIHPQVTAQSDSFLPTFGAILRLVHWHNAQVTIVHQGETTEDIQCLVSMCRARVVPEIHSLQVNHKIWMGKVSVTSKIEGHGTVFPGFSMSCEDKSLLYSTIITSRNHKEAENRGQNLSFGRMLEVLDEIDVRTIPVYMLSPLSVTIHLESDHPHSKDFLQYVHSLDKLCLIARIAVYPTDSVSQCADKKLNTASWKDNIMADISNVQEVEEEILPLAKYVHLVLIRDVTMDDPTCLKAIVMTSPEDINPELFSFTRSRSLPCDEKQTFDLNKFVRNLPQLSDDVLQELDQSLVTLQVDELKEWIEKLRENGESTILGKEELFRFLTSIQEEFLASVLKDCPTMKSADTTEHAHVDTCHVLDCSVEPADWPERLALQYLENQKRALRRFQSSDSVALSSPIPPEESGIVVDATDFLQCFHPDGNSAIDNLSPVRQQSSCRLKRLSSHGDTSLKWPECKDSWYHGIYYNRDKTDEQHAQHFSKMRDKLQRQETHGFCSSVHKLGCKSGKNQAKRDSHLFSPRKSSRKLKSAWNKEEVNLSCSSRHEDTFQSPKKTSDFSCTLRRSPRKKPSSSFDSSKLTPVLPRPNKRKRSPDGTHEQTDEQKTSDEDKLKSDKQSRSQRHKKKLEQIVTDVLLKSGVRKEDAIYKSCETKLFQVTKFFVKTLPNSRNLSEEMRHIAEGQVTQVVDLEKRRTEMKGAKKAKLKS